MIDGDEAFNLTMPIVQEIRQILDEEHNGRIGTAFWFGVISMLGGQFCQNPALTSKAQPLIKEVGSLANEFKIPNTIVASYIKSLNSKDPLLVQRSVMSFIESVSEKLA
ncbi:MAG: hypothetical protein KAI35_05560 [Desulfobulbaceae bacterium]|nr:hypothetical protein [Desulfobulbaceae bacterium]